MQILTTSSMDFLTYLRQEMHAPTNVYCNDQDHDHKEDDDDVFYDELRRQVLQLTDEDDDHLVVVVDEHKINNPSTTEARIINNGPCTAPRPGGYYNWAGPGGEAPSWMLNLWRSGNNNNNGTGVFIPQTVHSGRRYRSRKNKNERGRTYKRVEKMN